MLSLKPDTKGRITLGALAKGISSFKVEQTFDGKIILDPQVEIPNYELQILNNPVIMEGIDKGMKESREGKTSYLGSFAKYAKNENEL